MILTILITLNASVFASESQINNNKEKIETELLSLENGDEVLNFIKIFTVKDYIDGVLKDNIFSYNLEKFKILKRKEEKSNIYDINILKKKPINENNFIKFKEGYINITRKKENIYSNLEYKKEINKNYKVSNKYKKVFEDGYIDFDVNKLIDYYFTSKIGIDMNINQILSEDDIKIILKNKFDFIDNNESITLKLCLKSSKKNKIKDKVEINIENKLYYLLLNESCYKGIYLKAKDLLDSMKKGKDFKNESGNINFNKKYEIISFNLKNNNGIFLKTGKYFTKTSIKTIIDKSHRDKKYIYIKTKENNVKETFAKFSINKKCLVYNVDHTTIKFCNFKNIKEVNDINNVIKIL